MRILRDGVYFARGDSLETIAGVAGEDVSRYSFHPDDLLVELYARAANVRDFGAVGDSAEDDTAAIQAAVDSLGQYGGIVYFPPGRYAVTSEIVIAKSGVTLVGAARHGKPNEVAANQGSFIRVADDIAGSVFRFTSAGSNPGRGCGMRDLSIFGPRNHTLEAGVHVQSSDQFYMARCDFQHLLGRAIWTQRCVKSSFHAVDVHQCGDTGKPSVAVGSLSRTDFTQGSVFSDFRVEVSHSAPYMSFDANTRANKLMGAGFESSPAIPTTQQRYLDISGEGHLLDAIHLNQLDQNASGVYAAHVGATDTVMTNWVSRGARPSHVLVIVGDSNTVSGFRCVAATDIGAGAVFVTSARNRIEALNAENCLAASFGAPSTDNYLQATCYRPGKTVAVSDAGTRNESIVKAVY